MEGIRDFLINFVFAKNTWLTSFEISRFATIAIVLFVLGGLIALGYTYFKYCWPGGKYFIIVWAFFALIWIGANGLILNYTIGNFIPDVYLKDLKPNNTTLEYCVVYSIPQFSWANAFNKSVFKEVSTKVKLQWDNINRIEHVEFLDGSISNPEINGDVRKAINIVTKNSVLKLDITDQPDTENLILEYEKHILSPDDFATHIKHLQDHSPEDINYIARDTQKLPAPYPENYRITLLKAKGLKLLPLHFEKDFLSLKWEEEE